MNATATLPDEAGALLDDEPVFPETETGLRRALDYLGYAPCPVRSEMRKRLHASFRRAGLDPVWYVPSGCHEENVYDNLWQDGDPARFPGIVSDLGLEDLLRPAFVSRALDAGVYTPLSPALPVRDAFRDAGFADPAGIHHVYAVFPYVILADLEKLGSRPLPSGWADLLHPRYRGDVVINGEAGDIHEVLLFNLYRDHGEAGLAALGANVRDFCHPSRMAKAAGSGDPDGAALYVLPWFFAKSAPRRERTALVWPVEGAYANPLYLFARPDRRPPAQHVLDFLTRGEWPALLARVGFPPATPGAPDLPGKLRWPGWEFVRNHDLATLRVPLNEAFMKGRI
ncbi:hypothetical protein OPIT5_01785 [Opitutaceae bacterium TAV5]|nr:hypothetical protein OPIT5_01785 [Opitutaceae bacterium TAV5]